MAGHRRAGIGRTLAAAAAAAAALALAAVALTLALLPPATIPGEGGIFIVARGEGAAAVARRLEDRDLIRSSLAFRLLAKASGVESALKAGAYRIEAGEGAKDILDKLVQGRQAYERITLPEGFTLRQTAALLAERNIAPAAEFVAACSDPSLLAELGIPGPSLEGYLFPDTYLLPIGYGAEDSARAMVAAFRSRLAELPEAAGLSPAELQDRVTLASIVEREYRLPAEAPRMAGVFYNRLKVGMALQSCATVVYVITEKLGKPHPKYLYDRDIAIKDPYNTYIHRGLPPGPISSPGLTALSATLRPEASKYLYFRLVDEDTGAHHFSTTLEEHLGAASLLVKRPGG